MNSFDLRLPLGWLFLIIGILLEIAGIRPTPTSEGVQESININLIWGAVLIPFGLICLWLVHLSKCRQARTGKTVQKTA